MNSASRRSNNDPFLTGNSNGSRATDRPQSLAGGRRASGGFGTAWFNPDTPGYILNRLHGTVPRVDSLRRKAECAGHALAIITRLTEIIDRDDLKKPSRFVKAMCKTLLDTVTTHVGYDQGSQGIFLYQKLASGKSLDETFLDEEPDWAERVAIAKNFVSAMVALRRCNVVHLDCRPVNVFVDRNDPHTKVTLIDLDGCGVLNEKASAGANDSWSVQPGTLGGDLNQEVRPIWFPFDATWQSPNSGNFKYAERWSVLNETWRILSWSRMTALGWLNGDYSPLLDGFTRVREMWASGVPAETVQDKHRLWADCQRALHSELAPLIGEGLRETHGTLWDEFGLGDGSAEADEFFESLAAATVVGMVFPKWGADWNIIGSHQEIPPAKWIQDQLIPLQFS